MEKKDTKEVARRVEPCLHNRVCGCRYVCRSSLVLCLDWFKFWARVLCGTTKNEEHNAGCITTTDDTVHCNAIYPDQVVIVLKIIYCECGVSFQVNDRSLTTHSHTNMSSSRGSSAAWRHRWRCTVVWVWHDFYSLCSSQTRTTPSQGLGSCYSFFLHVVLGSVATKLLTVFVCNGVCGGMWLYNCSAQAIRGQQPIRFRFFEIAAFMLTYLLFVINASVVIWWFAHTPTSLRLHINLYAPKNTCIYINTRTTRTHSQTIIMRINNYIMSVRQACNYSWARSARTNSQICQSDSHARSKSAQCSCQ